MWVRRKCPLNRDQGDIDFRKIGSDGSWGVRVLWVEDPTRFCTIASLAKIDDRCPPSAPRFIPPRTPQTEMPPEISWLGTSAPGKS